tara:strand:+ start:214 stop:588 length:375 start_codon:yes stop_codon:yes gene_type:complete
MVAIDKHLKTYGVSTLDPSISPTDLTEFKSKSVRSVEKTISAKMEELKREYNNLIEHVNINKIILDSEIKIEPSQNNIYFLYERSKDNRFLSIINPKEWGGLFDHMFLFSARLNSDNQWEREGD